MRSLPKTMDLDELKRADPFMGSLLSFLASRRRGELYLVGGYLRDYFLGAVPADIDFITSADPAAVAAEVAARFGGKAFVLHEEERAHRVVVASGGDGRRTLDFSPIRGMSVEEDLSYRDFTVNAMALEVERLAAGGLWLPRDLVDKHYGWRDLSRGILRECSNESFLMDPVRLVRALRFRHVLGLEYEERTLNHMKKYAPLVTRTPGERVAVELLETLLIPDTAPIFADLESTGLMQYVFPHLVPLVGLEQNAYHHLDVWSHTLLTLEELDRLIADPGGMFPGHEDHIRERMEEPLQDLYPRKAFLRLAALYHDAGKAETVSRDASGRIHFYSHQEHSRGAARELTERLRLSRRAGDYVVDVVAKHMDIGLAVVDRPTRRRLRHLLSRLGEELVDVVLLSVADRRATRGPLSTPDKLERYVAFCAALLEEHGRERETPPLIMGRDLVREFHLPEGPFVGEILREVRAAQMEGVLKSREDALRFARDLIHRAD
ncbi:MAG: HD domain-containing protein [Actinobacteria bacterium]|nr:HD domain-containing protein [Actinomycetota bacterium]